MGGESAMRLWPGRERGVVSDLTASASAMASGGRFSVSTGASQLGLGARGTGRSDWRGVSLRLRQDSVDTDSRVERLVYGHFVF